MGRLALLVGLLSLAVRAGTSLVLGSVPATDQRWKDAAYTLYAASYRESYTYDQARVVIVCEPLAGTFVGQLVAANLKPNFAYQVKLEAAPGSDCAERLGSVGRYWREEWNGTVWTNGWNLNSKGTGTYPNPNDLSYLSTRDLTSATSPTGSRYRFTTYVLLGYFITDSYGNASLDLRLDASYHVLWRDTQTVWTGDDGPIVSRTFTPLAGEPAYDSDGSEQTVGIFGEWERLPAGGLHLPDGDYDLNLVLTEESFHNNDANDGWWATVMSGNLTFSVGLPPVFTDHPVSCLARSGDAVQFTASLEGGLTGGTHVVWYRDGTELPAATALQLDLAAVTAVDAGSYVCVATNAFGETRSRAAALAVRDDLRTEAEYAQAVGERDTRIADLESALADARPDRDGDGFTDAQEAERGTDPDRYTLALEPGWNLVSLARVPEDNTVAGIFGVEVDKVKALWVWNPLLLRYDADGTLEPQRGHWLFWDGEATEIEIGLPEHGQ